MQNPSAQATTTPTAIPGLSAPNAAMAPPGNTALPWRRAVGPVRTKVSVQDTGTVATSQTAVTDVLPGTGYMAFLDQTVTIAVAGTGNASGTTVTLAEDNPWSALASNVLDDGAAPFVNVPGYDLYLLNLYGGFGLKSFPTATDTNIFTAMTSGTGTGAGTGNFTLRMPFAINDRDLIGVLGNQDRQTKYNLRSDIGSTAAIYGTTAPSVLPTYTIARTYGYVPVPGALSADRRPQEVVPPHYGVIHYLNSVQSDAAPSPSSTVNHYLHNLNNALRLIILVFRAGTGTTPRALAETVMPTKITFYAGSDPIFSESSQERRWIMFNRYGIDVTTTLNNKGVLVYDAIRDFNQFPGYELGDEYIYLGDLSEAQFEIVYPSGFTAGGSLRFITSTLAIPPGLDLTTMSHA